MTRLGLPRRLVFRSVGIAAIAVLLGIFSDVGANAAQSLPGGLDPENTLYLDLKYGRVVIKMRPDLAPAHVARIKHLARRGFYNGLSFHRVIGGFMAQTGDPKGDGSGGSGKSLKAEFSAAPHKRGTVSMARATYSVDSADSQFFIMLADKPELDGQYTVWGEVVVGMDKVDLIRKGPKSLNGKVDAPDKIISLQVAADAS